MDRAVKRHATRNGKGAVFADLTEGMAALELLSNLVYAG